MHTQTVVKDEGYGPYFLVLRWQRKDRPQDEPMLAVFSTYADLNDFRAKVEANGNESFGWELGVDHTRRE